MEWGWHVVLFLFWWFVLSDTFYKHAPLPLSFAGSVVSYPAILILGQIIADKMGVV